MGNDLVQSFLDIFSDGLHFDLLSASIFLVLTAVITFLYWYLSMPRNLPPGPMGVPILGSIPFLGKQPHFTLNEMAKKYGHVFSLYLGSQLVIVLNDYEAMKEALVKQSDKFWSRPPENSFQLHEVRGVMPADDDTIWKTHRRFAIKTFRDVGVGKNTIEGKLMEEIQFFLKEFEKKVGKVSNPKNDLDTSVANNICNILFGKRFDYGDKEFLEMKESQDKFLEVAGGLTLFLFLPWTKYIPGANILLKRNQVVSSAIKVRDHLVKEWNSHRSSARKNTDNYTSAFIAEKQNLIANNQSDFLFDEKVYFDQTQGLFGAGMETTSTLLKWCIIYMIKYPELQKKAQKEVDDIIGKDRLPQFNDRLRTPYIEAFLMEVHRIVALVPLNVPHSNVTKATLFGYHIPKRSLIISNLWNVLHDPKLWDKPDDFKPERFLNEANEIIKPEYFIPFSIGKRACLGENLARMETYLYFTSLIQRFQFEAQPGNPPSTATSSGGLINTPLPFTTIIKKRN